ncbi:MAG: HEAT repeat domain-containing protein, partial [Acidobacteria bacterium]|nr:HEAT repeat domain-containing protein [Acidobacteriota bacterium]
MVIEEINNLSKSSEVELRRKAALMLANEEPDNVLPILKNLIGDSNWRVRKAAVESAILFPPSKVIPMLISGLFDPANAGLRNSSFEALLKIGEPSLPYLYETIVDEDPDVKLAIIHLLGEIPNRMSTPHLIYFLSHPNKNFVSAAVESIGKLKDPANLRILLDMTQRTDEWVLFHLIDALAEIGGPSAVDKLMELYSNQRLQKAILKAFGKMGDLSVIPFLFEKAESEETPILEFMATLGRLYYSPLPKVFLENHRSEMGRLIRKSYPIQLSEKLAELWESAKIPEKRGIAIVAGFVTDLTLLPNLFKEIQNPYIQRDILWAIGEYGHHALKNILKKLSETQSEEEKVLLIDLLSETQSSEAVAPLLAFSRDENEIVKREAISVLSKIDDKRACMEVLSVFEKEEDNFYDVALNSIKKLIRKREEFRQLAFEKAKCFIGSENPDKRKIGYFILGETREKEGEQALLNGLKDVSPDVKQNVIHIAFQVLGAEGVSQILPLFSDENVKVRRAVISALGRELLVSQSDALIVALQDIDAGVRAEAAFFLAQSTDPPVVRALLSLLETDEVPVKIAALRGLSEVGCGLIFDEVKKLSQSDRSLEVRRAALNAIAKSGRTEGKSILIDSLNDPNWEIRSAAIEWMANSEDPSFVAPLLRELEKDPDIFVKQTVIEALTKLKAI